MTAQRTIKTAAHLNRHAEALRARDLAATDALIADGLGYLTHAAIEARVANRHATAPEREALAIRAELNAVRGYVIRHFGPGAFGGLSDGVVPRGTALPEPYHPGAYLDRAILYTTGRSPADAIAGTKGAEPVRVSA